MNTNDKEIFPNVPIEELPSLPQDIIDAYEQKNLAVFVGAGISRLMGCQGWNQMANKLIDAVCKPSTAEQIKTGITGSKEKITIAKRIAIKNKAKENEFWKIFAKAIEPDKESEDIYRYIALLNTLFLTTNCDGLLVKEYPFAYTVKCTVDEYLLHKDEAFVFCVHGNWGNGTEKDKASLIFTTDEYLKAYQPGQTLPEFIKRVLHDKTVLFIGYGLSEFEILNAAFEPVKNQASKLKHYILEGFFSFQQELCNAKAEYYASINVNLVAFSKDNNGYEQQLNIVKKWIDELKNKTSYNSRGIVQFTDALRSFT